jgi:membrane protein YqaA with SNARE-associated domain
MILKIITVAAMASFEIYAALGTAHAFGMDTWTILFCTLAGGIAGVFIAAFLGRKIEAFINEKIKKNTTPKPKTGLIYSIWNKYGLYGIGLIGTFLVGAPVAIGVGVGFNADMKKLVPLCLIAVIARSFAFTFFSDFIKGLF